MRSGTPSRSNARRSWFSSCLRLVRWKADRSRDARGRRGSAREVPGPKPGSVPEDRTWRWNLDRHDGLEDRLPQVGAAGHPGGSSACRNEPQQRYYCADDASLQDKQGAVRVGVGDQVAGGVAGCIVHGASVSVGLAIWHPRLAQRLGRAEGVSCGMRRSKAQGDCGHRRRSRGGRGRSGGYGLASWLWPRHRGTMGRAFAMIVMTSARHYRRAAAIHPLGGLRERTEVGISGRSGSGRRRRKRRRSGHGPGDPRRRGASLRASGCARLRRHRRTGWRRRPA